MEKLRDACSIVPYEIIWEEDKKGIGAPKMVKKLVDKAKYDWVVFIGDDTLPEPGCIDKALKMALRKVLWLVGFNDHHGRKATHWLANKRLLKHLENEEFFFTGYIHNFCDDELRIRADRLDKYGWCEEAMITHNHPAFGTAPMDETYKTQLNSENWKHDEELFNKRLRDE